MRGICEGDDGRAYDVRDLVAHLKLAICPGCFCVNDRFWNSLAVKVRDEIDEVQVVTKAVRWFRYGQMLLDSTLDGPLDVVYTISMVHEIS